MSLKRIFSYYNNDYQFMGSKQSTLTPTQLQHQQKRAKRATGQFSSNTNLQHLPSYPAATKLYKHSTTTTIPKQKQVTEPVFNAQLCLQWFQRYADPDTPTSISPEGMQQFLQDLGISVEERMAIVVAWKLNISTMGYITQQEWMTGMQQLGIDHQEQLVKQRLDEFESALQDVDNFKKFYRYTFDYGKNKDQKCMDVDVACALWNVLFDDTFTLVNHFVQFLQEMHPVRVINRDQWQSFLEFVTTVSDDLSDHDETAAWPVLFDEFVEWKRNSSS
ncbi:Cullin binding-domain-containing protein [Halteromyces radiatus]|uniref:Cullin binding-domain-containing protein n=1 Tax=Halteromyces radiatus TaxID=101107 RepID=UPI00221F70E3|nr:Cullin binding-domain-containing protein [Halteromyces radiatus]KAI8086166.1 Cullin binding-domain-containing protein [Halteromyces radiatus]